ncbi:MAG: aminotransferase class I/II-fold pyridoxal phosphate-dependent enzyme, partial [Clostridia bacterium]|nr:aminotransferase class I/II-fold pyridoxal phosphate-dependent enzyme [Clostridia bacterium]
MSRFLVDKYRSLEVYTPGEQPQDMDYVKLNTNESPYPPSKGVFEAVCGKEVQKLALYPDPECRILREKIAGLYGVEKDNVFVSNGSDDILNFSFMAFCSDQTEAVFPNITYGFYKVFGDLHGVKYTQIPLDKDFKINVSDYMNTGKTVVIANPNAPTGLALTKDEVEQIVSSNSENAVVIDEAYVDFGAESCAELTKKYENLLVVQTYSKSRSMAGARLGFAIGSKALTDDLNRIKYSTN